jgi:hypothetical protein
MIVGWEIFAETSRVNAIRLHAQHDQLFADGEGSSFSQSSIVFLRAPSVAVPVDKDRIRGFGAKKEGDFLDLDDLAASDIRAIEFDRVGLKRAVIQEEFFKGHARRETRFAFGLQDYARRRFVLLALRR